MREARLKWKVAMSGETQQMHFGFIKVSPLGVSKLDKERVTLQSFTLSLVVFPVNFIDFTRILGEINDYTQFEPITDVKTVSYKQTSWKIKFKSFKESLPSYYFPFINECLEFISNCCSKNKKHIELMKQLFLFEDEKSQSEKFNQIVREVNLASSAIKELGMQKYKEILKEVYGVVVKNQRIQE